MGTARHDQARERSGIRGRVRHAVLAAALAAGLTAVGSAAPQAAASESAALTVATYSIEAGLSHRDAVSELRRLGRAGADVMGLQGMAHGSRRAAVLDRLVRCKTCKYGAYVPQKAARGATPILWKKARFALLERGSTRVAKATHVGRRGIGPATVPATYVNHVALRHRATGRTVYLLNSEAVTDVQDAAGAPRKEYPERLALHRRHMDVLTALVRRFGSTGAMVLSVGDLNVDFRSDIRRRDRGFPVAAMRRADAVASWESLGMPSIGTRVGTNGRSTRLTDTVFARRHPALVPRAHDVLRGYRSNHRPVLVRFAVGL